MTNVMQNHRQSVNSEVVNILVTGRNNQITWHAYV